MMHARLITVFVLAAILATLAASGVMAVRDGEYAPDDPLPCDTALIRFVNELTPDQLVVAGGNPNILWSEASCSLDCALQHWPNATNLAIGVPSAYMPVHTQFEKYFAFNGTRGVVAAVNRMLYEYGVYTVTLSCNTIGFYITVIEDVAPSNDTYFPILYAFLTLTGMAVAWVFGTRWYNHYHHLQSKFGGGESTQATINAAPAAASGSDEKQPAAAATAKPKPAVAPAVKKERLRSLDTFRGISLSIMMFVNFGGGSYWFFNHSIWNGLTLADLVFPWFIWMMGVSMALSFEAQKREKLTAAQSLYRIARRSAILFGLGLLVSNGDKTLSTIRIPGVLQRFGVSFFVVAAIMVFVPKRKPAAAAPAADNSQPLIGVSADVPTSGGAAPAPVGALDDLLIHAYEIVCAIIILAVHTIITFCLPVPGCPTGYLGPGGLADQGAHPGCAGGAAGYIDRVFLGSDHLYHGATPNLTYFPTNFHDPEGTLGCLTSIGMTFIGVMCGRVLVYHKSHASRLKRWFVMGAILGSAALALSGGVENGGTIPVNKNLWSLSFILALSGMGHWLLAICYIIIDIYDAWTGSPFIFTGMNSIAVYCASELIGNRFPFVWLPDSVNAMTHSFYLANNLWAVGLFMLMAFYMFTENVFVKV